MKHWLVVIAVCLMPATAAAQTDAVTTTPPTLVVSNYNIVPVGPFAGLEGTAYAARVEDPSGAWFNPAGLAKQKSAQISGSAGVYSNTTIAPQSLPNHGGSVQQLPNFVGFTMNLREGLTAGFAVLTNNAWNQVTDAQLVTTLPTGQERFAYSADSELRRRIAAFGVGFHRTGGWRFGGGLGFSLTTLRLVESTSDRIGDATGLATVLVTSRVSGSTLQMRGQGGVQYETGIWRFGGAIRTPGLNLYRDGSIALDGVLDARTGSVGASLFDTNASFESHLPWEYQGGVGIVGDRCEVEFDLLGYGAIASYSLMSTDQPTVLYNDVAVGPPAVIMQPFNGLTSVSDGVVNVGVGGHVKVRKDRNLRIHAGVSSSQSPVGSGDQVYTPIDLVMWTVGASGSLGKFQFSFGYNRQTGTTDDIALRNLLNGAVIQTRADVRMNGFVYQLAFQF